MCNEDEHFIGLTSQDFIYFRKLKKNKKKILKLSTRSPDAKADI